jgi:triacylglycerol lipase
MRPMARALEREGFSTLSIPYCSGSMPLDEIVKQVRPQIEKIAGDRAVHFVTHSLGGILARKLLTDGVSWHPGRIVMLAPPNTGSEIVDWSRNHPLLNRVLGPSGRCLGSDGIPCKLPALPPEIEAAVIMGDRCSIPVFRKLLDSDNDGIVSAAKGRIDGLKGFSVVHADHTFIQMHPESIRLSLNFLKTGEWPS